MVQSDSTIKIFLKLALAGALYTKPDRGAYTFKEILKIKPALPLRGEGIGMNHSRLDYTMAKDNSINITAY